MLIRLLTYLQIENYALLERVEVAFAPGFTVLTGETGSGKSILVDALGLLLGERADAGAVRAGAVVAAIAGGFVRADGEEIVVRREVGAQGRGRAFLDGRLASLQELKTLAPELGQIHSQHESLADFTPAAQLALLDRFAGAETAAVGAAFTAWRERRDHLQELQEGAARRQQEADLWRFQLAEIDAVQPVEGEDDRLEAERRLLGNAERVATAARTGYELLYDAPNAVAAQLKTVLRQIQDLARFAPEAEALGPRIEAMRVEAAEVAEQLRDLADRTEASPERLAAVEERLEALDRIKRRIGGDIASVTRLRRELAAKLDAVDNAAFHLTEAETARAEAAKAYEFAAGQLSRKRRTAATRLRKRLETETAELALQLRFEVAFDGAGPTDEAAWSASGWDRIRFLASTNPGEPLQPLAQIASGGELSRLLLALHVIAEGEAPTATATSITLVLDEVDAGIGGKAAEAVGARMQQLGRSHQVLCVTHLAQIASFGDHQLKVEKAESGGRTRTQVTALSAEERITEIARMLAGHADDPTARKHARELLRANAARA